MATADACFPCLPGKFFTGAGAASACNDCAAGTYAPGNGSRYGVVKYEYGKEEAMAANLHPTFLHSTALHPAPATRAKLASSAASPVESMRRWPVNTAPAAPTPSLVGVPLVSRAGLVSTQVSLPTALGASLFSNHAALLTGLYSIL